MKQMCSWKFLLSLSVGTELLEDKQLAKLGGSWYVQNVSTFLNTFANVFPHICVILNTTNTDWRCFQQNCPGVLFLCRNSTFGEKSRKIGKPIIFTEESRSQKGRSRRARAGPDQAQARPRPGRAWPRSGALRHSLGLPSQLYLPRDVKLTGGSKFF